jgi:putative transposase
MKRSKFSDEQILAIVKEGEAGRKVADLCRANGIPDTFEAYAIELRVKRRRLNPRALRMTNH